MPFEQHHFHKGRKSCPSDLRHAGRAEGPNPQGHRLANMFPEKKNKAFFNRLTILSFLEKSVENKQKNEEINGKYSCVLTALSDFLS